MNEHNFLQHYGVLGMKWGIRKSGVSPSNRSVKRKANNPKEALSKKKSNLKRNLAIGAGVATATLAVYGAYRYSKFIKDKNVEIAIEKGKKFAENMKMSDIAAAKKYPDVFRVKPDSHYDKYIKEYLDKAQNQKFSEAYKNVKRASDKARKDASEHKRTIKSALKVAKQLKIGKLNFGTMQTLERLIQFNPEIIDDLGISVSDGHIYFDGKKLY